MIAEIPVYKFGKIAGYVLVDADIALAVAQYPGPGRVWRLDTNGYATCSGSGRPIYMHRVIMNPPRRMVVDHIRHDRLDNRKSQLRVCTYSQNTININPLKRKARGRSSPPGVCWNKKFNRWQAYMMIDGVQKHLGLYEDLVDAVAARARVENAINSSLLTIKTPLRDDGHDSISHAA